MRAGALPALAAVLAVGLAGCFGAGDDGAPAPPATGGGGGDGPVGGEPPRGNVTEAPSVAAPWWEEGQWFEFRFDGRDQPARTERLVTFLNDSETGHFWLGVANRSVALEHAFFDTNPFLGRIHYDVLAPHESGRHAMLYDFPLVDGKHWQGFLFARDWDFRADAVPGKPGTFLVTGEATDGSRVTFDYVPDVEWFRTMRLTAPDGSSEFEATLLAHGTGAKGTYWFHRGRDYYAGPGTPDGPHTETFTVDDEGLDFLALNVQVTTTTVAAIDVIDPAGEVRERLTVASPTGGALSRVLEIPGPATGEWSLRFVTPGSVQGAITATGVIEHSGSL